MAYEGKHLSQCNLIPFPWHFAHIVLVSGAKWNPCGHAILNAGGAGGHYFHIAGDGYARPYYMDQAGYDRYLSESKKREIRRQYVHIPKPDGAQAKLDELASKRWLWGALPNNCAAFVEDVIRAGGSKVGIYSNCPTREEWR